MCGWQYLLCQGSEQPLIPSIEKKINITVRCTFGYFNKFLFYKYYAALPLQILRCSAPYVIFFKYGSTNISVRCTFGYFNKFLFYKCFAALPLQILRCAAPLVILINFFSTNITRLCRLSFDTKFSFWGVNSSAISKLYEAYLIKCQPAPCDCFVA